MPTTPAPPEPPIEMPPARTLRVPGRGELFLRDTGGKGPVVMLLHGWMATADLNWAGAYADLARAGYRVLAIDPRGHGRGGPAPGGPGPRRCRRVLDGRRDRPARHPRAPRRRLRGDPQRHRPA